jgi:hypothetical protein
VREDERPWVLTTHDGVYEVRTQDRVYRRLGPDDASSWTSYDRMSPVAPGEPVRFFVALEERGRSLHYRVVTTSPVVAVRPAA